MGFLLFIFGIISAVVLINYDSSNMADGYRLAGIALISITCFICSTILNLKNKMGIPAEFIAQMKGQSPESAAKDESVVNHGNSGD